MLWTETKQAYRFVSAEMSVFYIDILRQRVAVFSEGTPPSPPDQPVELVEGWEQGAGDGAAVRAADTAAPHTAQSSGTSPCTPGETHGGDAAQSFAGGELSVPKPRTRRPGLYSALRRTTQRVQVPTTAVGDFSLTWALPKGSEFKADISQELFKDPTSEARPVWAHTNWELNSDTQNCA